MSIAASQQLLQLQQELQNELTTANRLLQEISMEIKKIKEFTSIGGDFEKNIKQNAEILVALSRIQKIDLDKVPQMKRLHVMDTTQ